MKRKKCRYCSRFFEPDPRVGTRQIACGAKECQQRRRKESQRKWRNKNRDYCKIERLRDEETRKTFRKKRALYMRRYRERHRDYAKRDNERRKKARKRGKVAPEAKRRNQDERLVQLNEIKTLVLDLIPCRNQDLICRQSTKNQEFTSKSQPP